MNAVGIFILSATVMCNNVFQECSPRVFMRVISCHSDHEAKALDIYMNIGTVVISFNHFLAEPVKRDRPVPWLIKLWTINTVCDRRFGVKGFAYE